MKAFHDPQSFPRERNLAEDCKRLFWTKALFGKKYIMADSLQQTIKMILKTSWGDEKYTKNVFQGSRSKVLDIMKGK